MTDEQIISLYFRRNEQAIRETDRKYGRYCYKIANNILHNHEDTEEVLSDTWMKTWESIPPVKPTHLNLFLAKITRNLSFNKYKAKRAMKRGAGEITAVLDELEECISNVADVEEHILGRELHTAVNDFLYELPQRERELFVRRYFFVESNAEIAKKFGMSENHVRVTLSRSRSKLKKYLESEGFEL